MPEDERSCQDSPSGTEEKPLSPDHRNDVKSDVSRLRSLTLRVSSREQWEVLGGNVVCPTDLRVTGTRSRGGTQS